MMKVKKGVPFGHVKRGSDHPKKYKLKSMLGEMLRNRRISSDDEIVDKIDWSIAYGFESIGYTRKEVLKEKKQCKKNISEKYSEVMVKKNEIVQQKNFYGGYNGSLEYSSVYNYWIIVSKYLDRVKPTGVANLMAVPGRKLKNLLFTRKNYLKRQEARKIRRENINE